MVKGSMWSENKKAEVFALLVLDIPKEQIVRKTGVKSRTIYKWIKKYDWETVKHNTIGITDEGKKSTDRQALDLVINTCVQLLKDGELKLTGRDLLEALRTKRLFMGESTENIAVKGELSIEDVYAKFLSEEKKVIDVE